MRSLRPCSDSCTTPRFPLHQSSLSAGAVRYRAWAQSWISREVPCSALKGDTVPDSLPATPKSPPTRRVRSRGTPRVPAPLPLSPFSPPDRDRSVDCPAWSGRGSRPSRRTSGGGRSHEKIRDVPRGWGHRPNHLVKEGLLFSPKSTRFLGLGWTPASSCSVPPSFL